jgi:hypothetical protein
MSITPATITPTNEPYDFDSSDLKAKKDVFSPNGSTPELAREYPLKEVDEAGKKKRKGANIFAIVSSGCALVCEYSFPGSNRKRPGGKRVSELTELSFACLV